LINRFYSMIIIVIIIMILYQTILHVLIRL